jgi:broad specificity phosphatase PhoE
MIRHGQASFGAADYDRLSSIGERQARIVADQLCRRATRFDAVYTGTLARQRQTAKAMTAAYAANRQPMPSARTIPDIDEYDADQLWRHLRADVLADHPELAASPAQWLRDPRAFQRVFGRVVHRWIAAGEATSDRLESWPAFRARVIRGLRSIMQTEGAGKQVAVFSSAGPVAVAVQMATAMPDAHCAELSWQILNASITRFRYHKNRFTLVGFNDVAALEMAGGDGLLTYR